jgi:MFS family permease
MVKTKQESVFIENLKLTLRAFKSRNYRLFFTGYLISMTGNWLQQVAMGWLVYRLTGSAVLLGVVGFSGQIPVLFIAPLSGVLSDRWNKKYIILTTQTMSMIQAFAIAALVLTGNIQVWHIIVLSVFLGIANGFEMTARQSFVIEMVENKEDLSNAIALNSAMFNGARFIGPSIGGILIAVVGEGWCFLINGISFIAAISALLLMRAGKARPEARKTGLLDGFKEGVIYVFGFPPIRAIILFLTLASLTALQFAVIMPVFAKDILKGGPQTLGFLMTAVGAGALTGALYLASRKSVLGLGRLIPAAALVFGAGLISFSFSRSIAFSMLLLFITGAGMMVMTASCNTILQTLSDDDKRGRVMSFYSMAFVGMAPFGCLIIGWLAGKVNAQAPFILGGICCMAGAYLFWRILPELRKHMRPVYRKKGILPEVELGIEAADGAAGPVE